MIKRHKQRGLDWVAFYVTAKKALIRSSPEEVKLFALLIVGLGLDFAERTKMTIPLAEIEQDFFSQEWGISEKDKHLLLKSSELWEAKNGELSIPLFAYDEGNRVVNNRKSGSLGGKKKAENQRKKSKQQTETTEQKTASGYTIPESLKDYVEQEETENGHAKD